MNTYLGIDTSAYTTSAALVDDNRNILLDERIVLPVEEGQRGLRQSEALFLHIKNLPVLFNRIAPYFSEHNVKAIAASAFPRQAEGSYMPVFLAGLSHAGVLSSFSGVPLYKVSHQEGHIMAGLAGNNGLIEHKAFLAVHFSGGTSEILQVKRGEKTFFDITLDLAGSDLHAGQLVDRVGVAMGLPFPSGRAMEALALRSAENNALVISSAVTEQGFSFSGAENKALSFIKQGIPNEDIAFAILRVIANTLEKSLLREAEKTGIKEALLVGGVMADKLIRQRLIDRLEHPAVGLKLYFTHPRLSTDNAVGVAMLAGIMNKKHTLTK
ncbi:MAG TPA: peptidase M22 [Syntrophomonadaceae bacterium]|nr:peptidase M22 [Syntrophomonadaceae bacterium]